MGLSNRSATNAAQGIPAVAVPAIMSVGRFLFFIRFMNPSTISFRASVRLISSLQSQ